MCHVRRELGKMIDGKFIILYNMTGAIHKYTETVNYKCIRTNE